MIFLPRSFINSPEVRPSVNTAVFFVDCLEIAGWGCTTTETAAGLLPFFCRLFVCLFWVKTDGGYRAFEDIGLKRIIGRIESVLIPSH